jgi:hypothetical protein
MLVTVFWDVAPYSLVDDSHDDGGSKYIWNVGQFLQDYAVRHTRR